MILYALKAIHKKHLEYLWDNNPFSIYIYLMTEVKRPRVQNIPLI